MITISESEPSLVETLGVDLGCINSGLGNKVVSLSEASALEGGLKVSPVL